MVLGLGPVLRYELITTARRGRYYWARAAYGLLLLYLLWSEFQTWELNHPAGDTIEQVRRFAESVFITFAGLQGLVLLCLIPTLVAGVIADEYQRKTLHYLLASRLSSAEIVLGKLGARLVHVGTFVALGLPVVSLLALYGGLNPENVLFVYLGTFTMVLVVAGLSILISTLATRPRDAILAAYGLEALWLLVPPVIDPIFDSLVGTLRWIGPWVRPVNDWLLVSNPIIVWSASTHNGYPGSWGFRFFGWSYDFKWMFYAMAGIQGVLGLLFLVLAVAGLRPLRGSSWPGAKPQTGWWARLTARARAIAQTRAAAAVARNEILAARAQRSPCGDEPMLWKERHTTMGGGLRWLGSRPVVLFFSVLLGCYLYDVAGPVLAEMVRGIRSDRSRVVMNAALRESSTALTVLGMLAVAAAAAVSLTGEREQDTWVSLATTDLTPGEIVRAKQFGAVWSGRRIGLALLVLWTVGLLGGATHPMGAVMATFIVAIGAWFIAAVGVFISSRAKNSTRALTMTAITLFIVVSNWPLMVWGSLFSYQDMAALWSGPSQAVSHPWALTPRALGFMVAVPALYAMVAELLTLWSIRRLGTAWRQA
jgi:ABC-type transport system involved in multi-copper enzyme maturation permease subunit